MSKLFLTLGWLEMRRLKSRLWILATIIFGFAMITGSCDSNNLHYSISSTDPGLSFYETLFSVLPTVFVTFCALLFGALVIFTIPYRDKNEWESGQFQMLVMGDFNQYIIQLHRYLVYLGVACVFFLLISINSTLLAWKNESLPNSTILNFQLLLTYWFLTLVPLFIAFGCFISAVTTAYYRDGNNNIITLIKYLGSYGFILLVARISFWYSDPQNGFFGTIFLPFEVQLQKVAVGLHWEFPIFSLIVAASLLFWSGRVLEEVEA